MNIEEKKIEIFSGTGGVGKTTLATSRAIYLAREKKKILLITIDPAKRLKEIMGLQDKDAGDIATLKNPIKFEDEYSLDVLLMNPAKTMERIGEAEKVNDLMNNRIITILSKPYGGLNEILSLVELKKQLDKNVYDTIVLDTPPGSHFLDFLESSQKIKNFFDESFIEIFNYLGKSIKGNKVLGKSKKFIGMIVSSGIKKLLSYLSSVTGASFTQDFLEAVRSIYATKNTFLEALNVQDLLKDEKTTNWFLVTSASQGKMKEALKLQNDAKDFITSKSSLIINKSILKDLELWPPKNKEEEELKKSFYQREKELYDFMKPLFKNLILFPEIFKLSPQEHVKKLTEHWHIN